MATLTSCTLPAAAARTRRPLQGAAGGAPAASLFLLPGSGATPGQGAVMQTIVAPPLGGGPAAVSRRRCTTAGNQPSECFEAFCEEMTQFRAHGAVALVDGAKMKLLGPITDTARGSLQLLTGLMQANTSPLPARTLKEITSIGKSFVEVEVQCNYGSVRFNNIVVAIDGLMRMAEIFPGESNPSKKFLEKFVADGFVVDVFLGLYPLVKKKYPSICSRVQNTTR